MVPGCPSRWAYRRSGPCCRESASVNRCLSASRCRGPTPRPTVSGSTRSATSPAVFRNSGGCRSCSIVASTRRRRWRFVRAIGRCVRYWVSWRSLLAAASAWWATRCTWVRHRTLVYCGHWFISGTRSSSCPSKAAAEPLGLLDSVASPPSASTISRHRVKCSPRLLVVGNSRSIRSTGFLMTCGPVPNGLERRPPRHCHWC